MSTIRYTPGPWKVVCGEQCCFHRGNRVSIVHTVDDGGAGEPMDVTIAEVWPGDNDRDHCDGALIAAAPDLLEACEEVDELWHIIHSALKRIDCEEIRTHSIDLLNGIQDRARAAIAKARGESDD
jgi:hypothetical protein